MRPLIALQEPHVDRTLGFDAMPESVSPGFTV